MTATSATQINTFKPAMIVRELPDDLKPENRAHNVGFGALSDIELMQLVYSFKAMDSAVELINRAGDLDGLHAMSLEDMQQVPGVGPKAALAIKAALELGKRMMTISPSSRPQVRSPQDVANLLMAEMMMLDHEELRVVLLDTKNNVHGVKLVYSGSLNTAVVRVGEVFREAIRRNVASIIVVHNHPSGEPTPSPEDVRVTEMLVDAGKLLDIAVLDHIVIGRNRYVSLKERGLGFK